MLLKCLILQDSSNSPNLKPKSNNLIPSNSSQSTSHNTDNSLLRPPVQSTPQRPPTPWSTSTKPTTQVNTTCTTTLRPTTKHRTRPPRSLAPTTVHPSFSSTRTTLSTTSFSPRAPTRSSLTQRLSIRCRASTCKACTSTDKVKTQH